MLQIMFFGVQPLSQRRNVNMSLFAATLLIVTERGKGSSSLRHLRIVLTLKTQSIICFNPTLLIIAYWKDKEKRSTQTTQRQSQ